MRSHVLTAGGKKSRMDRGREEVSARRPRRVRTVLIVTAVALLRVNGHGQEPSLAEVMARAAEYVASFNQDLSSIVAEERYVQTWRRPKTKERGPGDEVTRRELLSDLMLVKPTDVTDWVQYRDVFEVDGVPVRDRVERLTAIFMNSDSTAREPRNPTTHAEDQIARIQRESARHNIGDIERNLNTPVFALQFLTAENQTRFKFKRTNVRQSSAASTPGGTVAFRVAVEIWVIEYEEIERPTIVHTADDRDVPARGRFWIEPTSGRVQMSELIVKDKDRQGNIDVSYQSEPLLGLLVPIEMRERYVQPRKKSLIEGAASYGRFRQFQVQVDEKIEIPPADPLPE